MPINVAKLTENTALHFMFILAEVFLDFNQLQGKIKRQSQPTFPTHEGLQATSSHTSFRKTLA
jgi:hypothetical protein